MEIRLRSTGEVLNEGEFRARFVQNLPPTPLTQEWLETYVSDPAGDILLEGPQASGGDHYQYSQRQGVEQIDGKWFTKYILGPVFIDQVNDGVTTTAAEQEKAYKAMKNEEQAKSVRQTRGTKLAESDWTQLADAPVDKAVWAKYRQALRDVTTQSGFPWTIEWPTQP